MEIIMPRFHESGGIMVMLTLNIRASSPSQMTLNKNDLFVRIDA